MTVCQTTTASVSSGRSASKRRVIGLFRLSLGLSTALTPVWAVADGLPTGGVVTHGDAAISQPTTSTLLINQGSNTAVVDWTGFSIGEGNTVTFDQPSATASVLNRVTGDATSQIHGSLNANGQVYVVNPNGIFIGKTGTVNAGGFVASTLGISNEDFLLGKPVFEGTGNSAKVTNQGAITIVPGGYAALLGGKVSNSGVILAPLGKVGLGAGERATLDFAGDGFLQVAVPSNTDDDGLEALIENSGTISANGGQVHIQAATARNAVRHAINLSGVVEARSVSGRNGAITLGGGGGGIVRVTGKLRTAPYIQVTQSARPPVRGGDITITGNQITLNGATLDASGTGDGGSIRVGGNFQGGAGLQRAETVEIDAASFLLADAGLTGDGGRVIVWSDLETNYSGNISARGGDDAGDGGFVEVSGKKVLNFSGWADMRAPNGDAGALLLDPEDFFIVETVSGPNDIAASVVNAQLELGDFIVTTDNPSATDAGNIDVLAALSWASGNRLTLEADNDININAAITASQGSLTLDAFNNITATAAIDVGRFAIEAGDWVQNTASLPGFTTTDFSIGLDASFLRVTGGEGNNEEGLYQITDVYGLQGIGTGTYGLDEFVLVNDIDATGTIGWNTFSEAFALGTPGRGFAPISSLSGTLDGGGFTIDGLYVDRSISHGGLIDTIADDATGTGVVRNLNFSNVDLGGNTAGALARDNQGSVTDVEVLSGTVFGYAADVGGLLAVNNGSISDSFSAAAVRTRLDSGNENSGTIDYAIGGLVGVNNAESSITNSRTTGNVLQQTGPNVDAGGFVGYNDGSITTSFVSAPDVTVRSADTANVGGFVGYNDTAGFISVSHANAGDVDAIEAVGSSAEELNIGGFAGLNDGTIENAYALTNVTARNTGTLSLGGFVGVNFGTVELVYSAGSVSTAVGGADVGGLVGLSESGSFLDGGFWDIDASGQSTSEGGTGLTTAQMQNTDFFLSVAEPAGWDIENIWAPSDAMNYPTFYSTTPVVFARVDEAGEIVYSGSTTGLDATGTFAGGAEVYLFGEPLETLDLEVLNDTAELDNANVGTRTLNYTLDQLTASAGTVYRVVSVGGDVEVTPAPLTITADDQTKTYGDLFTFDGTEFTTDGLLGSDTVTSAELSSLASDVTAEVRTLGGDEESASYRIDIENAAGTGLSNYDITFEIGRFQVTPAPLTITAFDQTKTYATSFVFDGDEFVADGLLNGDLVSSLDLASDATAVTATVAEGPYDITASNAMGERLNNYDITYVDGSFTVDPAALQINIDDQSKIYGTDFLFDGTEFTTIGLRNGDAVTGLELISEGAAATARVDGSDYAITAGDIAGSGLSNYDFTVVDGSFTVTPAPLAITANDQIKTYGDTLAFDGVEFSSAGLLNGDSIESVELVSDGTQATAQVVEGPFGIFASNAQGGDVSNYDITYFDGTLTVATRSATITADDQTKLVETEFEFDGSEFTVTGLVNDDMIASVDLVSEGAPAEASIEGSPYAIDIVAVNAADDTGGGGDFLAAPLDNNGLLNYDFTLVSGLMTIVDEVVGTPDINPIPPFGIGTLPNPVDVLELAAVGGIDPTTAIQQTGTTALDRANDTFENVDGASDRFESNLNSCDSSTRSFGSYVNCLAESLDEFSDALDGLEKDLPRGLEDVSAIIDNARDGVRAAGERANRRLASATTAAQRRAIQADAVAEARNALATAKTEIRKSISLIRAEDPDLRRVQTATVNRIVNAVDAVETKLVRAATL